MGTTVRLIAVLAGIIVWLAGARAQERPVEKKEPTKQAAMTMSKPAPEMERLKFMIGTWDVEATYEPTEVHPGGQGHGRERIRLGPGGFSLISDFRITDPMGKFSGHGILLWDPAEHVYKVYWVDSLMPGVVLTSRGRWEGNELVFLSNEYTAMGHKLKMKQVMTNITPTSATNLFYISTDGGPVKLSTTLKYKKRPAAAKKP